MVAQPHVAAGVSGVAAIIAWLTSNQALLSAIVSCVGIVSGVLAITWYCLAISLKIKEEIRK